MSVNLERDTTAQMRTNLENYADGLSEADRELAIYQSYNIGTYAADEDKYQIHHLIPAEIAKKYKDFYNDVFNDSESYYKDYDLNNYNNLIALPSTESSQNAAADSGFYAVLHRGNTGQHIDYNGFVNDLLGNIREQFSNDISSGISQKDASYFAAQRIFNLQNTLRNSLFSTELDGLNFFLHYDDPALIQQYNESATGNNSPANSTPKCDTRLCSLKVFLEHHFGLPESEAFTRPQV